MRKAVLAAFLSFALLGLTGAAMADNLQFGPVAVTFAGNGTTGSNLSIDTSHAAVEDAFFGTTPGNDTAIGDSLTFGTNPIAFFTSGSGSGSLIGTQTLTIGSTSSVGGEFQGQIASIQLVDSVSGANTLVIGVDNGTFGAGTGTNSVNLQELANSGGVSLLSFTLSGSGNTVATLTSPTANANLSGGNGSISAVPEPTSMLFFGTGLVGLSGMLRRRLFA